MSDLMDELKVYGDLLEGIDYDIVAIHPLADEPELLARLGLSPSQRTKCDMYWVFMNHMFFVSISCIGMQEPIVTYFRKENVPHRHSFYISTKACPITKTIVKTCLDYLAKWIEKNQWLIDEETQTPGEVVTISNEDIVLN